MAFKGIDMIKVKANKEIFEDAQTIAQRVMAWSGYVQNDYEFKPEDIKQFSEMCDNHIEELSKLKTRMLKYFVECNRKENG